jgi:multidrug efflux pump subunit AcrB
MINMDQNQMQAKGVSPTDVLNAVNAQNLILPSGTAKVAESELDVRMNVAPRKLDELNNVPIKQVGNTTIYLREVARVSDGFAVQSNIVRQYGHRGVLVTILTVSLRKNHHPTAEYVRTLRKKLPREFPWTTFYFLPAHSRV